jgi:uncharacterized membrane protein
MTDTMASWVGYFPEIEPTKASSSLLDPALVVVAFSPFRISIIITDHGSGRRTWPSWLVGTVWPGPSAL